MPKQLLIIFVKNIKLGKVKTRLAKTIGNEGAFEVYKKLVQITEQETKKVNTTRHIYFSDVIINSKWENDDKFVQKGNDIGDRMLNAFKDGFEKGYEHIVLIGSDLPDITPDIINKGFSTLDKSSTVFGPAEDGGYYLIGMTNLIPSIFINKPWSQPNLLNETLYDLETKHISFNLLKKLNDIDTINDLKSSSLSFKY